MAHFRIDVVIITDMEQHVILGLDLMTEFGCKVNLEAGVLKVGEDEVIRNHNKNI